MWNQVFFVSLAIGTVLSAAVAFVYSRSGSHPRFNPNRGIVGMVFIALLVVTFFLSMIITRIVGKPSPPQIPSSPSTPQNVELPAIDPQDQGNPSAGELPASSLEENAKTLTPENPPTPEP